MTVIALFCAALLICIVLRASILYALAAGLVIFTLYGRRRGFAWRALGEMIVSGVKTAASVLLVFPLIGMLTALWRAGGTLPCTFNAANEVAVAAFLRGEIHFLDIYDIIEQTMSARPARQVTALDDLFAEDEAARRYAASLLKKGR